MHITTISDGYQLQVDLLDYGARIMALRFADTNVVLGYPRVEDYRTDNYFIGTTVGPIANRIAKASLMVDSERFYLPTNEGANCLHSGGMGFDQEYWQLIDQTEHSVEYRLVFDLRRVGMRGTLTTTARYAVSNDALTLQYTSNTDTDTYINITNHSYFNLSGQAAPVNDHHFELFAESVVVVNNENLPTGELINIDHPHRLRLDDVADHMPHIHDHHLNVGEQGAQKPMLKARSTNSGVSMLVSSTSPGFQFYDGEYLSHPFIPYQGFCVETQFAPDAINQDRFYSPLLRSGQPHVQTTTFRFSHKNLR